MFVRDQEFEKLQQYENPSTLKPSQIQIRPVFLNPVTAPPKKGKRKTVRRKRS